jgi:hypothetical protein
VSSTKLKSSSSQKSYFIEAWCRMLRNRCATISQLFKPKILGMRSNDLQPNPTFDSNIRSNMVLCNQLHNKHPD